MGGLVRTVAETRGREAAGMPSRPLIASPQANVRLQPLETLSVSPSGTWISTIAAATSSSRFTRLSYPLIVARSVLCEAAMRPAVAEQKPAKVSTRAFSTASARAPVVETHPALKSLLLRPSL